MSAPTHSTHITHSTHNYPPSAQKWSCGLWVKWVLLGSVGSMGNRSCGSLRCHYRALRTAVQINDVRAYPLYPYYPLYPFYPLTAQKYPTWDSTEVQPKWDRFFTLFKIRLVILGYPLFYYIERNIDRTIILIIT